MEVIVAYILNLQQNQNIEITHTSCTITCNPKDEDTAILPL